MLTKIRVKSVWLIVPIYLYVARPSASVLAAGVTLALLGAAVRAWAAGAIHKNRVLTTHGPYAFTRNPLYLGSGLIGLGFAIASGRPAFLLGFGAFFAVIYGRAMVQEERRLERNFGEEFRAYASAVPRFFPRLPRWSDVTGETSPGMPAAAAAAAFADEGAGLFQLRRYLANREYQALMGIGVMFLLLSAKLVL